MWSPLLSLVLSFIIDHISGLDPDANLDTSEIIKARGFLGETHFVQTEDGYILTVHRILNPHLKTLKNRRVTIVQHGLLSSSRSIVINSVDERSKNRKGSTDLCKDKSKHFENGLGFVLSKLGFDVWLPNTRGSQYSQNHSRLTVESPDFWKFTFDEMVKYDLPAYIKYIQKVTGQNKISYIGHSEGAFSALGLLSLKPEYEAILEPVIALAPVYTQAGSKTMLGVPHLMPYALVDLFRNNPGPLLSFKPRINNFFKEFCEKLTGVPLCFHFAGLLGGYNLKQVNLARYHTYFQDFPGQTSTWNIGHYFQLIKRKTRMEMFDYGKHGNLKKYSLAKPPVYNLDRIRSEYIAIIHSKNDYLVTPDQISLLKKALKVKLLDDYEVPDKKWTHFDFVTAKDLGKLVVTRIVKILKDVLCK